MKNEFKGNKKSLPSKPCAVCGRTMSWRKAWAKNWASVLYCSDACRAQKPGKSSAPEADANQGANTAAVATKRTAPRP